VPDSVAILNGSLIDEESAKPRFLISDLCVYLETYLRPDQIREVYRAYLFSAEAHEGQRRKTGEPYIYHPVAVARILATQRMDHKCLMAAILHDVIEDTPTMKEQLAKEFGDEIAELVDGVSKLTQFDFKTQAEAQAANFRKMLLAMTKDIRVILIKLADRLHNMRTLGVMGRKKRRRIALETLEIYAPIANRLGINSIRLELEELGFAAYWPIRHQVLKEAVKAARGNRKELVRNVEKSIRRRLRQEGLTGEVVGREKHLYSLYKKMVKKKLTFTAVADVYAFRIIVDGVDTCYRILGAVHNLYKPVPGRFKDYIAIPKANGYQSLHTVLFGPQGMPIEIQIRTQDMHRMAESGVSAHWLYKNKNHNGESSYARASEWLQDLLELQKGAGDSIEFLEHVKVDLFPDEVYVFTPRGRIMVLPKGATVVDFAYAVHTDVGNGCVAARIERRLAPLRTALVNGQTVEIITAPGATPNPAWLNFVVSSKARANIRGYLKNLQHQEAAKLGRRLLKKELSIHKQKLEQIPEKNLELLLADYKLDSLDALFEDIGLGNRLPMLVARRILGPPAGELSEATVADRPAGVLAIKGTEGMVVSFAKCCRPIPGDPIAGVFSRGRGIVVHNQDCPNLSDFSKHGDNWVEVEWAVKKDEEFSAALRVEVGNQRGVLATVAAAIAETDSNIENVSSEERDGVTSSLLFVITARNRKHLAKIIRRIRALPAIIRITRVKG